MNISIGYLPNRYREFTQDEGGHFPFAVDNTFPYVLSVGVYLPECDDNFVPSWMDNIKAFPLYFYADIDSFLKNEYEEILNTSQIEYRYLTEDKKSSVSVAKIQDIEQLLTTFPFYITLGCVGCTVVWSTEEDVFSVEQREWGGKSKGYVQKTIVVEPKVDMSIFVIGHDGNSIDVLSNQAYFSTCENITKTLPEFVIPSLCEFG